MPGEAPESRSLEWDIPYGDLEGTIVADLDELELDDVDGSTDGDDSVLAESDGMYVSEAPVKFSVAAAPKRRQLVVPFVRTIKLGTRGYDVIALKRALSRAHYLRWRRFTPIMGRTAVAALKKFQHEHGVKVDGVYGPLTHVKLARYYDARGVYLLHKVHIAPSSQQKRLLVRAAAILTYNHRSLVHYTQGPSRMQGVRWHLKPPSYGHYEDCSSHSTWLHYAAGLPDPNGLGYNGFGFTGTMGGHTPRVSNPRMGSFALYGSSPYRHVTTCMGFKSDGTALVVSHGSEIGPVITIARYRGDFNHWCDVLEGK